ncbi:hypothetical protein Q7O_000279 [Pectobacterium carotovorum subsp. carotovorum PCCS1]|nr:hypothetical protein [Pectobacterium carotovorum subsp. carotovorum PCCS1]
MAVHPPRFVNRHLLRCASCRIQRHGNVKATVLFKKSALLDNPQGA